MSLFANQGMWLLVLKVILVVGGLWGVEWIARALMRRHIVKKASKDNSPIRILSDVIVDALTPPLRVLVFGALAYSIEHIFRLSFESQVRLEYLNETCLLALVVWALYRMCEPVSHIIDGWGMDALGKRFTNELRKFLVSLMRASIVVIGGVLLLDIWRVDVGPLLAGLGLFGVALSFAAQETIKHFFGGVTLIMDRPFQEGDWIEISGIEGIVERVGLRSTHIRQFDDILAVIPNADLANTRVQNKSAIKNWRLNMTLWVSYDTPPEVLVRVEKAVQDYVMSHPRVDMTLHPSSSLVKLANFGSSAYEIICHVCTRETDWKAYTELRAEFLFAFSKIISDQGATVPYTGQSIYIEKIPTSLEKLIKAS